MEHSVFVVLETDIFKAQRISRRLAQDLGFGEVEAEEAAIIASELSNNLVKHRAINGEIIVRRVTEGRREGLEIVARDEGPGIADINAAMRRSTVGTLGIGLSGVRRLSDYFVIDSASDRGTTVTVRKWLPGETGEGMHFSVFSRPKPGEDVNGDSWFIKHLSHAVFFGVIDALGHGRDAYLTSLVAMDLIELYYREPLETFIVRCHEGLRTTRGVAMSVCHIDYLARTMRHVGIGNVETQVFCTPRTIRPYCYNGTLGMRMERYKVNTFPYEPGELVVMYSDGISGSFDLPGGGSCPSPQEVAAHIFNNFTREYDDATVLVGK